jgi:hypothetical protein
MSKERAKVDMGLKQIYDSAQSELSTDEREDDERFSRCVVPLVTQLAARINKDPDLGVSFKVAGDDGGFFIQTDTGSHWWALEAQFRNKADNTVA